MLGEMKAKGEKMLDAEKATFAKYTEWVDDQTKDFGFLEHLQVLETGLASCDQHQTNQFILLSLLTLGR